MTRISAEEYRAMVATKTGKKDHKYGAKEMTTGGKKYASTKEGKYSQTLDWKIRYPQPGEDRLLHYKTQVTYSLDIDGIHICNYILDFEEYYESGKVIHVDVKGLRKGVAYQLFKLKKHLMFALWGIDVLEI